MVFKEELKKYQNYIDEKLDEYFKEDNTYEKRLRESMRYSLLAGGKRIRPILMLATYRLFKDDFEKCLPFAIGMEMVHNASLIHDDMPCIDNDDFRHGKPTNHKMYDECTALLAGDALFNYSNIVITDDLREELDIRKISMKIMALNEFVKATDVEFEVTTDKETQEVKMIDKVVEISKQDISGNELEGATLVVTSTKTKNIVDKWVSGKEPHKVNGLIENEEYILHEEIVVDGYVKATDVKFTVTSDKETQKVIIIDKILEVVKTDLVTGEEIEGAELKVIDEDGNVIDEWTSTKEPHKVVGLEENKKYKLVEITAPYGYEITEEIEFTVSEDKETQRVEMKDMPILQNIKLVKIDSNTKEVIKDKFTFGIYEDAECTKLIKEVKSDKENGTVLFEDLRYGTYYIKEIAAPKGYVLSDKVIKVEMNDKGIFIDNEKVESEDSTYTFEFENVPVDTPKTGDNSNLKLYAGLLGLSILALASVGVHEYKKRKSVNKK